MGGQAKVGEQRQQQQQQIESNKNNFQLQDKRFQELKAFALEYVKQIVAKASELSQERHEVKNAEKLTQFYSCNNNNTHSTISEQRKRHCSLISLAANQINERFRLTTCNMTSNKAKEAPSNEKNRNDKSKFVNNNRINNVVQSTTTTKTSNQRTIYDGRQQEEQIKVQSQKGRETLLKRMEDDDYYDDLDDGYNANDNNSYRKQTNVKSTTFPNNNNNSSTTNHRDSKRDFSGKRKLYQRLNWHLFVSCFNTCLPHTLVETAANNTEPSVSSGTGR